MRGTFTEWLMAQVDRLDNVGDLARDASTDPDWPAEPLYVETVHSYLLSCNACDGAIEAGIEAVYEWAVTRDQ